MPPSARGGGQAAGPVVAIPGPHSSRAADSSQQVGLTKMPENLWQIRDVSAARALAEAQ